MSRDEAIREIEKAKAEGRAITFADENPHWWMGVRTDGTLWSEYFCCDTCEQDDIETHATIEELRKEHPEGSKWNLCEEL